MPEWIVLGSAHAVPDEHHANTHFALRSEGHVLLIDAPCEVEARLHRAGISPLEISDLILTHFHPDHVGGVPMLLMAAWLRGRTAPLHVYGLNDVITRLRAMMDLFRWEMWPGFFPLETHVIADRPMTPVLRRSGWQVWASPVAHMVPTVGLRIAFENGEVLAYSCDTGPNEAVVRLAQGADYLFHEATGAMEGHTSAEQAGEIAARAGARRLYLVHTDPSPEARQRLAAEAHRTFAGEVVVAEDLMRVPIG